MFKNIRYPDSAINLGTMPFFISDGTTTSSIGSIPLVLKANDVQQIIEFTVVDQCTPFNAVLGRPWLHKIKAIPLIYHQCLKFPSLTRIKTIRGSQKSSRACYMKNFRKILSFGSYQFIKQEEIVEKSIQNKHELTTCESGKQHTSFVNLENVSFKDVLSLRTNSPHVKVEILSFLKWNLDTFAWSA